MKNITVSGHEWSFVNSIKEIDIWTSNYVSSDNDHVLLFVEKDKTGFELRCFSGIPASRIYIDVIDFGVFNHPPNEADDLDFMEPFEFQCCRIADYLCSKFCEYLEPKKQ